MPETETQQGKPHLFAGCIAVALTLAALLTGRAIAIHAEHRTVPALGPEVFPLKIQGLAFQRAAAQARDVLPLYGSSEMGGPHGWRAPDFFRTAPTGFQVSAVGKPGATTLILLQKIGALDRELRGKRIAVSLSSLWFLGAPIPSWYEGNFSRFAASQLIFDSGLSFRLKHDVAARMIDYPRTLEKTPLLAFAVRCLASGSWFDRIAFWAIWPLGKLQDAIWDLQDHFAALGMLREAKPPPPRQPQTVDWPTLIAKAEETAANAPRKDAEPAPKRQFAIGSRDAWFRSHMDKATGWTDLELLLRLLQEIQARPLLLAMPMNGLYFNPRGVSRSGRQEYYDRLNRLAQEYHAALANFPAHDEDPNFLDPHLTAKGWSLFNRAIDDFMHDRLQSAGKD